MTYISLPEIPTTPTITTALNQSAVPEQRQNDCNGGLVTHWVGSETLSPGIGYIQENHSYSADSWPAASTAPHLRSSKGISPVSLHSSFIVLHFSDLHLFNTVLLSVSLSQLDVGTGLQRFRLSASFPAEWVYSTILSGQNGPMMFVNWKTSSMIKIIIN